MATKNIVPNSDGEGKLGTSSKSWAEGHIDSITGTIATAANILREGGAERVFAACTHGLFIEDAANRLRVCDDILSSDTLEGVYTRFSVAPAIADAL